MKLERLSFESMTLFCCLLAAELLKKRQTQPYKLQLSLNPDRKQEDNQNRVKAKRKEIDNREVEGKWSKPPKCWGRLSRKRN